LSGGDVHSVPDIGDGDPEEERREFGLGVVTRGLVPDFVRHGIRPVAEAGHGFGERQRSAFGVTEVERIASGCDGEEALAGVRFLPEAKGQVNANAAAVDLAGAEVNKTERLPRDAPFSASSPSFWMACTAPGGGTLRDFSFWLA
jgi:hypothetical protein